MRRWTGATGCCRPTPNACCARWAFRRRHDARVRPRGVSRRRVAGAMRWRRSSSTRWCGSTGAPSACGTDCWRPCASTRSSGLQEAGEADAVRDRHRDAFLALAESEGRDALTPRQPLVFAALDAEAANLEAALARALATDPEAALRACLALQFWFRARGRFHSAAGVFERALDGESSARGPAGPRAGRVGVDRGQWRRLRARERARGRRRGASRAVRGRGRDRRRIAGARQSPLLHGPDGRRGSAAALPRPGVHDRGRVPARALGGVAARHRLVPAGRARLRPRVRRAASAPRATWRP